jgi:hypothetical protein
MPNAVVMTGYGPPEVLKWAEAPLREPGQSLGMTDVASNMEFTEYDADELYIR